MALQSQLLRSDPKLEASAVSDPNHIIPGATGEHVRKIQIALIRLDGATIAPDGIYGPTTAAAVLAYKQKRNIINRSYQTKADNIVGKMTIAALDKEMLATELKPVLLQPLFPGPRLATAPRRGGALLFAFNVTDSGPSNVPNLIPTVFPTFQQEVIIPLGMTGTMQVLLAAGGKLFRTQPGNNFLQVARLNGAKTSGRDTEILDILQDNITVSYLALACGETFFQVVVQQEQKLSSAVRLLALVLVSSAGLSTESVPPPAPGLKSGLVSTEGTPLKPLDGRKINLFGEKETNGFEDYSSDIDHCSTGSGRLGGIFIHRPWTSDPRTPPGIGDKSVSNICGRGSPMNPVTIAEILRIGRPGCRVTYAEGGGNRNVEKLRAGLKGAKVIDEGAVFESGRAIVFELT